MSHRPLSPTMDQKPPSHGNVPQKLVHNGASVGRQVCMWMIFEYISGIGKCSNEKGTYMKTFQGPSACTPPLTKSWWVVAGRHHDRRAGIDKPTRHSPRVDVRSCLCACALPHGPACHLCAVSRTSKNPQRNKEMAMVPSLGENCIFLASRPLFASCLTWAVSSRPRPSCPWSVASFGSTRAATASQRPLSPAAGALCSSPKTTSSAPPSRAHQTASRSSSTAVEGA